MIEPLKIKSAASSALNNLSRASFSENGFSSEQIDAISEAITSAIVSYDEQKHSQEN